MRPAVDTRTLDAAALTTAGRLDEAERLLEGAVGYRAALERARIGYKRQRWQDAEDWAIRAAEGAREASDRTTQGRAFGIAAEAAKEQSRPDLRLYECAIALLDAPDAAIYRACVENDFGTNLYGLGRRDEAKALFRSAYETAARLEDMGRALTFNESICYTIYDEGRYDEAIAAADAHIDLAPGDPEPLCYALRLRTLVLLTIPDDARAASAAESYEAAAGGGGAWDRVASGLLVARARAVMGDTSAVARFDSLTREADALGAPHYSQMARLWRWAALVVVAPIEACVRRRELYLPAVRDPHPITQIERRAVDRTWHPHPALDLSDPDHFPRAGRTADALEAALYLAAFRHSGGASTRMAELLGRDRRQVARKMVDLGLDPLPPGRPRRS